MRGITCEAPPSRDPDVTVHRPRCIVARGVRRRPANNTERVRACPQATDPTTSRSRASRAPTSDPRETRLRDVSARTTRTLAGGAHGSAPPRPSAALSRARVARGSERRRERPSLDRSASRGRTRSTTVQILDSLCDFSTPRRAAALFSARRSSASRSIWTGRSRPRTCLSNARARRNEDRPFARVIRD